MSYLQKKKSKKAAKKAASKAATADSPAANSTKPTTQVHGQSKMFIGRRSGTR